MLRSDPARPRITTYDDTDGPTRGERIELSARVLSNWVNKAANALQDEFDIAPGRTVHLDLPPHWRTAYWALATWSVGAAVSLGEAGAGHADLLVTTDPEAAGGVLVVGEQAAHVLRLLRLHQLQEPGGLVFGQLVEQVGGVVTLAGLARSAPAPVPAGVMDEARELSTHGDQFATWEEPEDSDQALVSGGERTAYADVVVPAADRGERRHLTTTDTADFLVACLSLWAADGSVVLSRGEAPADALAERSRVEGASGP